MFYDPMPAPPTSPQLKHQTEHFHPPRLKRVTFLEGCFVIQCPVVVCFSVMSWDRNCGFDVSWVPCFGWKPPSSLYLTHFHLKHCTVPSQCHFTQLYSIASDALVFFFITNLTVSVVLLTLCLSLLLASWSHQLTFFLNIFLKGWVATANQDYLFFFITSRYCLLVFKCHDICHTSL